MKKGFLDGIFKLSVRDVVALGIGAALFFILSRFVSVPTFVPNTSIQTSYAFLALMSVIFGPIAGCLIGFIGHLLTDISYGGPWISWIIASGMVGLVIGFSKNLINISSGTFGTREIITFNVIQIIANAFAWFVVAPTLDILIYAEPANKVYLQGLVAGTSNIITVAIIGTILLFAYSKTIPATGSLKKDN